jgi:(2R)-ethylmalonyl-CoA mutase
MTAAPRDRPWLMRTYAGHSSAAQSNALYRRNLAKGQTGLSVAFDLPTQTGYDADHALARGEVGRVGVPVGHLGDMRALFDGIPLEQTNTSMTINAPALWMLALYQVVAQEQGADITKLAGTTQNDIVKEYLSRGTYIFPPGPSVRLTTDLIAYTVTAMPRWNPVNVCSYHLQEAGATPVQEIAYALGTAVTLLDAIRERVPPSRLGEVVGRVSFFVNAGVRFVEEMCKLRAFARLWDAITRERYGIEDPKLRRFRYGVQVNSLGLTEAQPENNIQRIVLEMLAVTLSRNARARAVQLPAWNEALGLPRPEDQQWSLRIQQVLAYESDLLEYGDLFDGSPVVEAKTAELAAGAQAELAEVEAHGGMVPAVESGFIKARLVAAHAARRARVESGADPVVGVNCFQATEPSPLLADPLLAADGAAAIQPVDPASEQEVLAGLAWWRKCRDGAAAQAALDRLRTDAARPDVNLMEATLACARAGVTTGEWSAALRDVFGEYRAPTGLSAVPVGLGTTSTPTKSTTPFDSISLSRPNGHIAPSLADVRAAVHGTAAAIGAGRLRLLLGKPGLDGHSNGVEQIAVRARDAGFEVIYSGIRLTPGQIAAAAAAEDVHCVGLSVLSGGHAELVPEVLRRLRRLKAGDIPVVVGGIIPPADAAALRAQGVAAVFTPADTSLTEIVGRLVGEIRRARDLPPWPQAPARTMER